MFHLTSRVFSSRGVQCFSTAKKLVAPSMVYISGEEMVSHEPLLTVPEVTMATCARSW